MTAIIANNAVFYGFMVLQGIIELITAEGDSGTACDIAIEGTPFYQRQGDAVIMKGFAFHGGSDYATFRLVATITINPPGPEDEVTLTFGRQALFDEQFNALKAARPAFEFQPRDVTADTLASTQQPFVLMLKAEALPLVAWLVYTLFVEYRVCVAALDEEHTL
ncbi:hypothetical protein PMM47T1_21168 [Pseudomonas sp. M47T1]|uniref:hypothetical protein n=1 Tax=unclassified Pseudomonas TaxID=196821 RepID=UPI00026078EB|nr:hypothetical protein [Pseudomonas sp. M47T1]EIK94639.1 hypothetical protein PMM47T1_21168 [Pseudomonas sp. M47T1]